MLFEKKDVNFNEAVVGGVKECSRVASLFRIYDLMVFDWHPPSVVLTKRGAIEVYYVD